MKVNTNTKYTNIALVAVLIFTTSTVFGQASVGSKNVKGEKEPIVTDFAVNNSIAGSWYVSSTPNGGVPFKGMITFSDGGGLIASAQGDNLVDIGSLATAGHGTWERTGNREFLFTFRQILYRPDGSYDGGVKVRHTAMMDRRGMEWTGQLTVEIFNANDEVVFSGTGSGTAIRIVAEPLLP